VPELPGEGRVGLLVHEEDLHPEGLRAEYPALDHAVAVAGQADVDSRSPLGTAAHVQAFTDAALDDGLTRASDAYGVPAVRLDATPDAVAEWARSERLDTVAVPYAPVGPVAERMPTLAAALSAESIALVPVRRRWDDLAWPHASRGYFPFREKIPRLVHQQQLG